MKRTVNGDQLGLSVMLEGDARGSDVRLVSRSRRVCVARPGRGRGATSSQGADPLEPRTANLRLQGERAASKQR